MKIYTEVSACIHECPFYAHDRNRVMRCTHPVIKYLEEDAPQNIPKIDWRMHKDSVPDNCPLKDTPVNTHVSLRR